MEQKGINPEGVGLVALALAYLTATPGAKLIILKPLPVLFKCTYVGTAGTHIADTCCLLRCAGWCNRLLYFSQVQQPSE